MTVHVQYFSNATQCILIAVFRPAVHSLIKNRSSAMSFKIPVYYIFCLGQSASSWDNRLHDSKGECKKGYRSLDTYLTPQLFRASTSSTSQLVRASTPQLLNSSAPPLPPLLSSQFHLLMVCSCSTRAIESNTNNFNGIRFSNL